MLIDLCIIDSSVDTGDVRFALSLYSHAVYNYFYLNTHSTVAHMLTDIASTSLPISEGTASEHIHSQVFVNLMGDYTKASNLVIVIVITDGKS